MVAAMGASELVVADLAEYEEKAVALATKPTELRGLLGRLAVARTTGPLFDIHSWVADWERLVEAMAEAPYLPPRRDTESGDLLRFLETPRPSTGVVRPTWPQGSPAAP